MKKNLLVAAGIAALSVTACVTANNRNVASISDIFRENMEKYSTNFGDRSPARNFTAQDVAKLASSGKLDLVDARLITDNDAAFDSKLAMIKRATREIRMVYFIYGDDDSSSLITQALIEKAQKGVQVKLLVDFITNYSNLDHYQMMVNEGKGNLKVSFYNFPSSQILHDAKYMTLPCPPRSEAPSAKECAEFKAPLMKQIEGMETTPFSKMYLAGLYGKSATSLKIALGYGGGIDPADFAKMKAETDDQEKAVLVDFLGLVKDAAQPNNIIAKLKLASAITSEGATLNPFLNELTGRLPVTGVNPATGEPSHSAVWDHLTDYTHHKLVAVDGHEFQLGGRNVEDSYHMKNRIGSKGKYIFMDTDFYGKTSDGGTRQIEASYDKLFNWSQMVAPIERVQQIAPIDMVKNPEALMMATGSCMQSVKAGQIQYAQLGGCIEQTITKIPAYKSQAARLAVAKQELKDSTVRYTTKYKKVLRDNFRNQPFAPGVDKLSQSDLANAEVYYLENVTYSKDAALARKTGSRVGAEAKFNKNIHAAWYRGMENACKVSRDEKREVRVIMHSAYLFMPAGMMHKLAKMMNGDYGDCSRVHITFMTNSFETTDLNAINVFARYQFAELFSHYRGLTEYEKSFNLQNQGVSKYTRFFPTLDYYEYNASSVGTGISLHTKLSVLGDDIIVGSANADVRSYYMDTNNGVIIRNAKDLIREYVAFVDGILQDKTRSKELTNEFAYVTGDQLKQQNEFILGAMLQKWDKKGRVTAERKKQILGLVDHLGEKITNTTRKMLNFRGEFENLDPETGRQLSAIELELNNTANSFDDTFKTF